MFSDTTTYSGSNVNLIVNDGIYMAYWASNSFRIYISMTTPDNKWQIMILEETGVGRAYRSTGSGNSKGVAAF
jgi:hypothetical protein